MRRPSLRTPFPVPLVLGLLAGGASRSAAREAEVVRPNIVLCMADDQGWGDAGYQGHPVLKTPQLDALAAAGLRFDRFYAAAPVCSPTRGSVMTGRHPNRFGCFKWGNTLRPREITIARRFREAGYATGHFGKWHLGSVQKTSPVNPGACGFDRWLSAPNFYDNDPILSREGVAVRLTGESSAVAADAAIGFIREQARARKPFLAVVWFGSPHQPHAAAPEDAAPYREHGGAKADFYGEIAGLDRAVGRLRREIDALGIRKDTIFWYCSDNGGLEGLSVTGGRAHKGSTYEGGLRVPGVLEWPARIPEPRATGVVAVTSDIFPTLLDLAGLAPGDRPLDGISLVPLLEGRMGARPSPVGFWNHPTGGVQTPSAEWMADLLAAQAAGDPVGDRSRLNLDAAEIGKPHPVDRFPGESAWLDWPWKLHRREPKAGPVKFELYHLGDDPMEADDRSAAEPERVRALRAGLEAWLASVVRSLNGGDYR